MGGAESSIKRRTGWLKRKSAEPGKTLEQSIREYLMSLNQEQLSYLATTYQSLSSELIHYKLANTARPTPQTLLQDFSDLLDYKYNCDVEVRLPSGNFLAHRPLLLQRSGYFHNNLKGGCMKLNSMDPLGFSEFLRWVYGAAVCCEEPLLLPCEVPLQSSLVTLFNTRRFSDCVLTWLPSQSQPCHVCVLSARSPLLRSLLSKKKQLLLDDDVIPFRLSTALLCFMYTDQVDLGLIQVRGDSLVDLEELYYCGQFLEMDSLTHRIETLLIDQINSQTYGRILTWAEQSFASKHVQRACMLFMQESWFTLIQSQEFLSVSEESMLELAGSDFTQCPESELVDSLLRWSSYHCTPLPPALHSCLRLDYITNTALLKQVWTRPSVMLQSRPRYWAPIHAQLRQMVEVEDDEEEVVDEGSRILGVDGDPELTAQLSTRYKSLCAQSVVTTNIAHWLRLRVVRELGLPDSYEKCLREEPEEQEERALPDVASNIVDRIVDLDLGDRY